MSEITGSNIPTKVRPEEPATNGRANVSEILAHLAEIEVSLEPTEITNVPANISDLTITTDSVVATATVKTDDTTRRILVDWADGDVDTLIVIPGRPAHFGENDLPAGVYQLRHAYAVPEGLQPFNPSFDYFVTVRVEDTAGGADFRVRKITLTPRYRVTNYRTSVRLTGPCDFGGSTSEFDITQLVDGRPVKQWHWEPSNNFFGPSQFFRLEGSGVSRELTLADESVFVRLELIERDLISDNHISVQQSLSAGLESELIERKRSSGGCEIIARYDREVSLIVPLPVTGPTFEAASG